MKNILKTYLILGIFFVASVAVAQINLFDIQFPISELGNCGSMEECKVFCDDSTNHEICFDWAKSKGLVKEEKSTPAIPEEGGPGGCSNREECDDYCDGPEHMDECLDFAVKDGFMTQEEANKIREWSQKTGPGGCGNHEECDTFCSNPDNTETCIQFSVDEGRLTQEEADFLIEGERIRRERHEFEPRGPEGPGGPQIDEDKAERLIEKMGGPGGCSAMDECENFCEQPKNEEVCFSYAIEHGLISEHEQEKFKKIMEVGGPGGCHGHFECDDYCSQLEHQEECMQFAIENDLFPPEEIEMMKKMMEIDKMGPGGCRGREECDAYCNNPEHGEECFNFGKKHGLMPPEEIERMEREMEIIRKLEGGDMTGPGGCMGPRECDSYCSQPNHFEECMKFGADKGFRHEEDIERRMEDFRQFEFMMDEMLDYPERSRGEDFEYRDLPTHMMPSDSSGHYQDEGFKPFIDDYKSFREHGDEFEEQYRTEYEDGFKKEYEEQEMRYRETYREQWHEGPTTSPSKWNPESIVYPVDNPTSSIDRFENKCDYNNDGKVDDYEHKRCANEQQIGIEPIPMPIMPLPPVTREILCDIPGTDFCPGGSQEFIKTNVDEKGCPIFGCKPRSENPDYFMEPTPREEPTLYEPKTNEPTSVLDFAGAVFMSLFELF